MSWQALLDSSSALPMTAFLLDLVIGDPKWLPHPVVLMGKFIAKGEQLLWSGEARGDFLAGMAITLALLGMSAGGAWALLAVLSLLPPFPLFLATAGLASTTLATRGLLDTLGRIEKLLTTGKLIQARKELSQIVGRETQFLSEDKVIRTGLESLAENTSDGIVAPLFYLFIGGVPAAMIYKAVNTLDSMIGYRTERYLYFGRFAARLDDCLNFIPARITAFLMVLAAYLQGLDGRGALSILWRDHGNHLSPNAGCPEATLAGALGIRLGGPSIYFGQEVLKPYIGEQTNRVEIHMLKEARWLCLITATLSLGTFLLMTRLVFGSF